MTATMSQPSLFDALVRPISPFEVGMRQSQKAANAKWTPDQQMQVDLAILRVSERMGEFTADDVWKDLGPGFPVNKGMAARLNAMARKKMIVNTGRLVVAQRGGQHDHGQRLTIWAKG